jgi:hypothetical protein
MQAFVITWCLAIRLVVIWLKQLTQHDTNRCTNTFMHIICLSNIFIGQKMVILLYILNISIIWKITYLQVNVIDVVKCSKINCQQDLLHSSTVHLTGVDDYMKFEPVLFVT